MADDDKLITVMQRGFDTLAELIGQTNAELGNTNARLDATNARLDALTDEVRHNGRRIEENGRRIEDHGRRIELNGARIDSLIEIAGRENRSLREDFAKLEKRVDALEQKAS